MKNPGQTTTLTRKAFRVDCQLQAVRWIDRWRPADTCPIGGVYFELRRRAWKQEAQSFSHEASSATGQIDDLGFQRDM